MENEEKKMRVKRRQSEKDVELERKKDNVYITYMYNTTETAILSGVGENVLMGEGCLQRDVRWRIAAHLGATLGIKHR